jgi:hypothetical protein
VLWNPGYLEKHYNLCWGSHGTHITHPISIKPLFFITKLIRKQLTICNIYDPCPGGCRGRVLTVGIFIGLHDYLNKTDILNEPLPSIYGHSSIGSDQRKFLTRLWPFIGPVFGVNQYFFIFLSVLRSRVPSLEYIRQFLVQFQVDSRRKVFDLFSHIHPLPLPII